MKKSNENTRNSRFYGLNGGTEAFGKRDDRLYYMTGNGSIAATFEYGSVYEIFGPPYTSPSLFHSRFQDNIKTGEPVRTERAPVWEISVKDDSDGAGSISDFVHPTLPVLVRTVNWSGSNPLTINFYPNSGMFDYVIPHSDTGAWLLKSRCGNYVYNDYPLPFPQYFILKHNGDAEIIKTEDDSFCIEISGSAELMLIGGPDYPEVCANYNEISEYTANDIKESLINHWNEVFSRMTCFDKIPVNIPRRDELISTIESGAIGILVQQGLQGGVLAGHAYHLGYVRDQYGVSEGLIGLGLIKEARKVLEFYVDTYNRQGKILNAQGIGVSGLFHFAENDNVEITGYLLLQFFRYLEVSGDNEFIDVNIEFLKWLYDRQVNELQDNELPFNGDETYIACGLLSRDAVSDGSAEATLLFIRSGELLSDYLERKGEDVSEMRRIVAGVKDTFASKFVINGRYYINDPYRKAVLPEFRYGVCMGCGSFGWSALTAERSYVCTSCLAKGVKRVKIDCRVSLPTSLMMPAYLGADLNEIQESIAAEVERLVKLIETEGVAFSVPEAKLNVGYDYGLLLYNIIHYGLEGADIVYDKLLDLRDGVGMFSERYIDNYPEGTRFRPWETAINIDAMLKFVKYCNEK